MSTLLTDDNGEVVGVGFDLDEMDEFFNCMMGSGSLYGASYTIVEDSIYDGIEFAGYQVNRMFAEASG